MGNDISQLPLLAFSTLLPFIIASGTCFVNNFHYCICHGVTPSGLRGDVQQRRLTASHCCFHACCGPYA
ncbi:hypothetical protein KCP75_14990 [Salmonella enterica subsp. enterica]|nr:hypothetical protein KCP75_14990 [Salmonella enterica subsp. enterica]